MARSLENCVPNTPMCFIFLNFLAESSFRDIETVGDPKNKFFGYNVSSSICGGITWTLFSCHVSGSSCN